MSLPKTLGPGAVKILKRITSSGNSQVFAVKVEKEVYAMKIFEQHDGDESYFDKVMQRGLWREEHQVLEEAKSEFVVSVVGGRFFYGDANGDNKPALLMGKILPTFHFSIKPFRRDGKNGPFRASGQNIPQRGKVEGCIGRGGRWHQRNSPKGTHPP